MGYGGPIVGWNTTREPLDANVYRAKPWEILRRLSSPYTAVQPAPPAGVRVVQPMRDAARAFVPPLLQTSERATPPTIAGEITPPHRPAPPVPSMPEQPPVVEVRPVPPTREAPPTQEVPPVEPPAPPYVRAEPVQEELPPWQFRLSGVTPPETSGSPAAQIPAPPPPPSSPTEPTTPTYGTYGGEPGQWSGPDFVYVGPRDYSQPPSYSPPNVPTEPWQFTLAEQVTRPSSPYTEQEWERKEQDIPAVSDLLASSLPSQPATPFETTSTTSTLEQLAQALGLGDIYGGSYSSPGYTGGYYGDIYGGSYSGPGYGGYFEVSQPVGSQDRSGGGWFDRDWGWFDRDWGDWGWL